jgi:hypothetical protein
MLRKADSEPYWLNSLCLQYHYRPGTFTGWLAHVLDDYSQRRKSEQHPVAITDNQSSAAWQLLLAAAGYSTHLQWLLLALVTIKVPVSDISIHS